MISLQTHPGMKAGIHKFKVYYMYQECLADLSNRGESQVRERVQIYSIFRRIAKLCNNKLSKWTVTPLPQQISLKSGRLLEPQQTEQAQPVRNTRNDLFGKKIQSDLTLFQKWLCKHFTGSVWLLASSSMYHYKIIIRFWRFMLLYVSLSHFIRYIATRYYPISPSTLSLANVNPK